MVSQVSVRELRERLSEILDRVRQGHQVVVTRHGTPVARVVPDASTRRRTQRYPLRGSVLRISEDFDEPLTDEWEAVRP